MHSTNYFNTLICPSPDCKTDAAVVPSKPGSVAAMQYVLLAQAPYERTSDDVLSRVAAERNDVARVDLPAFRDAFFSKGQPCFRASPLTKTHGWAVHADGEARLALVDPNSERFEILANDPDIRVIDAMRNKRS